MRAKFETAACRERAHKPWLKFWPGQQEGWQPSLGIAMLCSCYTDTAAARLPSWRASEGQQEYCTLAVCRRWWSSRRKAMVRDARYLSDPQSLARALCLRGTETVCLQLLAAHDSPIKRRGRAWTHAVLQKGVTKAASLLLLGLLFASNYYMARALHLGQAPSHSWYVCAAS